MKLTTNIDHLSTQFWPLEMVSSNAGATDQVIIMKTKLDSCYNNNNNIAIMKSNSKNKPTDGWPNAHEVSSKAGIALALHF